MEVKNLCNEVETDLITHRQTPPSSLPPTVVDWLRRLHNMYALSTWPQEWMPIYRWMKRWLSTSHSSRLKREICDPKQEACRRDFSTHQRFLSSKAQKWSTVRVCLFSRCLRCTHSFFCFFLKHLYLSKCIELSTVTTDDVTRFCIFVKIG